jgi:hypothetical protein
MIIEEVYGKPIHFMRSEEIHFETDSIEVAYNKLDQDRNKEELDQGEQQIPLSRSPKFEAFFRILKNYFRGTPKLLQRKPKFKSVIEHFLFGEKVCFNQTDNRKQNSQNQDGILGIGIQKTAVIIIEKVEAGEAPYKQVVREESTQQ